MTNPGTLHGVGVGPGDPELVTVRAARLIGSAPVLAYFAKKGRRGHARTIVEPYVRPDTEELPLHYPLTTEMSFADPLYVREVGGFYEAAAEALAAHLAAGRDVVLIAEGDPLFYGSSMYLHDRLADRYQTEMVPGAPPFAAAAAATGAPAAVYEYEPEEDEILGELLPRYVATQIFRALLENNASFYGSQMSAMDNATRNAGDMIRKQTITYNRTRQAMITKELIEIISGAEAL